LDPTRKAFLAPDGKRAYGVSFGSDSVWVIDTGANAVITSVTVGSNPVAVAVTTGIGPPTSTDQCKRGEWRSFDAPRSSKNQGECLSFVNTGKWRRPGGHKDWSGGDKTEGALFYQEGAGNFDLVPAK